MAITPLCLGPRADRRLAFPWDRLGYVHHRLGNDEEAETCYLRSLAIQDQSRQESTTWNEVTALNLATLYRSNGQPVLSPVIFSPVVIWVLERHTGSVATAAQKALGACVPPNEVLRTVGEGIIHYFGAVGLVAGFFFRVRTEEPGG